MDDEALLAVVYRGRPTTIDEVATLSHLTSSEARDRVERLRVRGILGGSGEDVAYPNPAAWVADAVAARSDELRRHAETTLAEMERAVAGLPDLLSHWSVGEATTDLVPMFLKHGPTASEELWYDMARYESTTLNAVLPEVGRFLSTADERTARFAGALRGKEAVRVIIPTSALSDPAAAPSITRYSGAGVQYRALDQPPTWFWVDGDNLGLPFEWGEDRPTSVLGVRSSALAGMAGAYFESLWARADPIGAAVETWTTLLRLMRQGMTLDTASRTVGINPRTGRRRISAAMGHYGVSTLFALGVAWAADGERGRS